LVLIVVSVAPVTRLVTRETGERDWLEAEKIAGERERGTDGDSRLKRVTPTVYVLYIVCGGVDGTGGSVRELHEGEG
jgi:hypothetical protein